MTTTNPSLSVAVFDHERLAVGREREGAEGVVVRGDLSRLFSGRNIPELDVPSQSSS